MDSQLTALDKWIKWSSEYGASWIFMVSFLGLSIWVAVSAISILKKWIPTWFQSSIESHQRVAKAVEDTSKLLQCIHEQTHATRNGARHATKAVRAFNERAKEPFPSAVMSHMKDAEEALANDRTNHEHRE